MQVGRGHQDLVNIVLASGTGKLNKDFKSAKSALYNHFEMDGNIMRADGDGHEYNVVVEDENVVAYGSDSIWPTDEVEILGQYTIPYYDVYAGAVFDGRRLSRQLGGWSVEDYMGGKGPKSGFPTLINEFETKLWNIRDSFMKKSSDNLYNKRYERDGSQWPDGFDVMFEPDSSYGGISYKDLGEHDWISDLMGTAVYRHNPLYKDFGGTNFPTIFEELNNACSDISKGRADISDANRPLKIKAMVGVQAFAIWDAMFFGQRAGARSSDADTNIGITKPITWDRWGLEIYCDHYCPNDKMYIWAEETVKKICQTGPRGSLDLRRVRLAFAMDKIHVPYTVEYNYGCSARWQICQFMNMNLDAGRALVRANPSGIYI